MTDVDIAYVYSEYYERGRRATFDRIMDSYYKAYLYYSGWLEVSEWEMGERP